MKKIIFTIILIAGLVFSCRPATDKTQIINPTEEVDITYIDFNTICPHNTEHFKTCEEEYQFLREQNAFLKSLINHYNIMKDNIDAVMFDGIDAECNYSGQDILNWLYEYYEEDSESVDSLYNTQN